MERNALPTDNINHLLRCYQLGTVSDFKIMLDERINHLELDPHGQPVTGSQNTALQELKQELADYQNAFIRQKDHHHEA